MTSFVRTYDYLFKEIADHRVYDWPLMKDPVAVLGIILVYLYAIYVFLPTFMVHRKPLNLKGILFFYNAFQIIACSIIIYGIATSGWTTHYTLGCQAIDYSEDKMAKRMAKYCWWMFMLKLIELIETVFFVLRKKFNQVTQLHVYHHVSTFIISWIAVKYIAGGMTTFTFLINSFVHILMYTYYLLSALGPSMQRKLSKLKPKLTMIQMASRTSVMA